MLYNTVKLKSNAAAVIAFSSYCAACGSCTFAQVQSHPLTRDYRYGPDRNYDLKHVLLELTIDYPHRKFNGNVQNTIVPFRNGMKSIILNCGANLRIESCAVNGKDATFVHEGEFIRISPPLRLIAGKRAIVKTCYSSSVTGNKPASNADVGFHWIVPSGGEQNQVGFWTQGETQQNHKWVPTWDYPNSLATSETRTTVPADWTVIGNGELIANTLCPTAKARTYVWRMRQPHATYLLSLVGGPFEVKKVKWRGIQVMYVVPQRRSNLIDDSFAKSG